MRCNFLKLFLAVAVCFVAQVSFAQSVALPGVDLTQPQTYVLKRVSSADPTGGNADFRRLDAGATLTLMDADGPGEITHLWFTVASPEEYHLKKLVLRIYWDQESTASVEAPLGDFFGLGLGEYHNGSRSCFLSAATRR